MDTSYHTSYRQISKMQIVLYPLL
uniref:Uncharacterized protein n=1 Tax=Arundo donax TaxID=35708 RepID=A0A0A9B293_ARUDO